MRKKILILHGWGGSNFPHWQSWLAGELAKDYGYINFLKFSNFDEPKFDIWMNELKEALTEFRPDIVICHSLANSLWFHLCNKTEISTVEKLYLVAPPSMNCKVPELSEFFPVKTPSKLYAKTALLVTSTNDPYMSVEEANKLQKELNIDMKILKNAGHINADSGFGAWKWMLEEINK
jgi:predicted alpha/beta hydrolase family esterase